MIKISFWELANMSDDKKLKQAYKISAKIVTKFGSKYLPVFERLHNEIQKIKTKSDLIFVAMQIENE